jgi:hypothetical protein
LVSQIMNRSQDSYTSGKLKVDSKRRRNRVQLICLGTGRNVGLARKAEASHVRRRISGPLRSRARPWCEVLAAEFETASAASRDLGAPSNEIQYTALATLVLSQ